MTSSNKDDWFTIEIIDGNTSIISEYKHWGQTQINIDNICCLIETKSIESEIDFAQKQESMIYV